MAKANTALRKKAAAVIAAIRATAGMTIGPLSTWNDRPCRTWALRSSIASQIHIAGSTCTTVRRQFENTSFTPWKSISKAPTARARGASQRRERLIRRTAASTIASSPSRMAATSSRRRLIEASSRRRLIEATAPGRSDAGASRPVGSVSRAGLHALAVALVEPALRAEGLDGVRDVVGQRRDAGVPERLLDQRAHDRHVLGFRGQRVGGDHPPALGSELRGDVELVEVALLGELEGDERQLLGARVADELEVGALDHLLGERARVGLHRLHDHAVALAPVADEVVVLREDHGGAGREVQGEGGVALAEVVLVEDQVIGQVAALAEDEPAEPRVDEPVLMARYVDRAHTLEAEVPRRVRVEERPHEAAAGAVDVQRHVEAALVLEPDEQVVDADDVVGVAGERRPEDGRDADRVLVDVRLDVVGADREL